MGPKFASELFAGYAFLIGMSDLADVPDVLEQALRDHRLTENQRLAIDAMATSRSDRPRHPWVLVPDPPAED